MVLFEPKDSEKTTKTSELSGRKVFIFGGSFLIILALTGFGFWWFAPKAKVTVFVAPQKRQEKLVLSIDPKATELDLENSVVPGEVLSTNEAGDKTRSTSGVKKVGVRAKGSVKIQNGTGSDLVLPTGTAILGPSDLEYTTGSEASVSAAISPTSPGTAVVDVTAVDIGAEYNLVKDEIFRVASYPGAEVDATAVSDFTGGSSSQIAAVSEDDQSELEKQFTEELISNALSDFENGLKESQVLVEEALSQVVIERSFSDKVGDAAETLKLSLSIEVKGLVVDREDLIEVAKKVLADKIPEGFVLRDEQIDMEFEFNKSEDEAFEVEVSFTANFLPEIKSEEIASEIAGKYPSLAENYLVSISGFTRVEITIDPNLPGRLKTLPRIAKNITVEIAAER